MCRSVSILVGLICVCAATAQTKLVLPYDAKSLTAEQKVLNPDRLSYPTAMKETVKENMNFQCIVPTLELGPFSVSPTKKVIFSAGNLQYSAAKGTHQCADGTTQPGTWRFAEHQWDYVGDAENGTVYEGGAKCNNELVSSAYDGWIDLFGWGTSGWNSGANAYQPFSTSTARPDDYPGNDYTNNLTGEYAYADWGIYNTIMNGSESDPAGTWRTLAKDEWEYLLNGRDRHAKLHGHATVNNVLGIVILPDNWIFTSSMPFNSDKEPFFEDNIYTIEQWTEMEKLGAVFLPASSFRWGESVITDEFHGGYWSTTSEYANYVWTLIIVQGYAGMYIEERAMRSSGLSVRLVKDIPNHKFSVAADRQVEFSPGNLQYQASTNTWRFAEHQWDYVGDAENGTVYEGGAKCNNELISSAYDGWIDLFGWGTGNAPVSSSESYDDYSSFTEWGDNAILYETYEIKHWRTLSKNEWTYLFHERSNAEKLFGLGMVNGINGTIILPDDWSLPSGADFVSGTDKGLIWKYGSSDNGYFYYNSKGDNYEHNG